MRGRAPAPPSLCLCGEARADARACAEPATGARMSSHGHGRRGRQRPVVRSIIPEGPEKWGRLRRPQRMWAGSPPPDRQRAWRRSGEYGICSRRGPADVAAAGDAGVAAGAFGAAGKRPVPCKMAGLSPGMSRKATAFLNTPPSAAAAGGFPKGRPGERDTAPLSGNGSHAAVPDAAASLSGGLAKPGARRIEPRFRLLSACGFPDGRAMMQGRSGGRAVSTARARRSSRKSPAAGEAPVLRTAPWSSGRAAENLQTASDYGAQCVDWGGDAQRRCPRLPARVPATPAFWGSHPILPAAKPSPPAESAGAWTKDRIAKIRRLPQNARGNRPGRDSPKRLCPEQDGKDPARGPFRGGGALLPVRREREHGCAPRASRLQHDENGRYSARDQNGPGTAAVAAWPKTETP